MSNYYFYDTATGLSLFKGSPGNLKLITYEPFSCLDESLKAEVSIQNSELSSIYKSFIKANFVKEFKGDTLYVPDVKLAQALKDKYEINCLAGDVALQTFRDIQANIKDLIPEFNEELQGEYQLALSHSFSRYRIQFNAESIDTMIVESVSLLDESEKELNVFVMRLQEWAVWTFPEAAKVITDHERYCNLIKLIKGDKELLKQQSTLDLLAKDFTEQEINDLVHEASISLGSDITPTDAQRIEALASQCLDLFKYQQELTTYITSRTEAIAFNLSQILTPLVAARMIAKAGSLMKLAKLPASTVQILGAEKALFLSLKTKDKKTPKHGLIYNCQLVQNASQQLKGKMSRIAAQNAVLSARVDCLSETPNGDFARQRLENGKLELTPAKKADLQKQQKAKRLAEYVQAKGGEAAELLTADEEEARKAKKEARKAEKAAKKAAKEAGASEDKDKKDKKDKDEKKEHHHHKKEKKDE